MKKIAVIMLGLIFLIAALICPLPTVLAVPGIVWRIIIGLLGCFLLAFGIIKLCTLLDPSMHLGRHPDLCRADSVPKTPYLSSSMVSGGCPYRMGGQKRDFTGYVYIYPENQRERRSKTVGS